MGSFSIWHWLIVLLIVVLVFGTKKLRNIGSDVGGAVKNFKEAMGEEKASTDSAPLNTIKNDTTSNLIEAEAEAVQTPAVKAAPRKRATSAKTATTTKPKILAKPKATTISKAK